MFSLISKIRPEDESSYQNNLFLTFDIDWCHDEVLLDTINILEKSDIAATWFVTHDTPVLERLRSNPKFELGIHPNFNFLLQGDSRNGKDAEDVVDRLLNIVPEAKSVRSHSMTQNSRVLDLFHDKGLTHDCNHFIPEQSGIELKPWYHWNGMVKVPYFWEDDVTCITEKNTPIDNLVLRRGLKVFDFHPIHIYLNTHNLNMYEQSREFFQQPKILKELKNKTNRGTHTFLLKLIGKDPA